MSPLGICAYKLTSPAVHSLIIILIVLRERGQRSKVFLLLNFHSKERAAVCLAGLFYTVYGAAKYFIDLLIYNSSKRATKYLGVWLVLQSVSQAYFMVESLYFDLTYYLQYRKIVCWSFYPIFGFSRVNSCACVRSYLCTSSTAGYHFKCSSIC